MWKWIRYPIFIILFLLGLVSATGFCLLKWPGAWITPDNLALAGRLAALEGVFIRWDSLQIQFHDESLLSHGVQIQISDLSIHTEEQAITAQIPAFEIGFVFQLSLSGFLIKDLNHVKIQSKFIKIKSISEETQSSSEKSEPFEIPRLPLWLSHTRFDDIDFDLQGIEVRSGTEAKPNLFKGFLNFKSLKNSSDQSVQNQEPSKTRYRLVSQFVNQPWSEEKRSGKGLNPVSTQTIFSAEGNLGLVDPLNNPQLDYQLQFSQKSRSNSIIALLQGTIHHQGINLHIDGKSYFSTGFIKEIQIKKCDLSITKKTKDSTPLELDCPINFVMNHQSIHPDLKQKLSSLLKTNLKVQAALPGFPPDLDAPVNGFIHGEVIPFKDSLLGGRANINTQFSGKISEFPRNWKLDTDMSAHLDISHFESLVDQLKETSLAIPAPFHSLHGSIHTDIDGKGDLALLKFPYQIKTQLESQQQKISSTGTGTFFWQPLTKDRPPFRMELDLLLSDVQLILPELELGNMPQLVPDPRFKKQVITKPEAKSAFAYQVNIRTNEDQPIRLLSNFTNKSIPVSLHFKIADDSPPLGSVQVKRFPIRFFRRTAQLEKFDFNLKYPTKLSTINGLILVDFADYQIQIEIVDTIDRPRIKISSTPHLPENQVIATLFFGHPIEELDSEQAASSADIQAAIENRAMDLVSLYIFASTPVQSVAYDPANNVLSARVKLQDGTSLNVGAATDELRTLGIRKRLGKNWVIQTDLNNPADPQNRNLSTFIEWSLRH